MGCSCGKKIVRSNPLKRQTAQPRRTVISNTRANGGSKVIRRVLDRY